jgi:phospholipid-binding lipoprotein MlaA
MNKTRILALMVVCSLLTACASTPSNEYAYDSQDPYQTYNRAMFKFNDVFYQAVAMPINTIYTTVTPEVGRDGIRNFFRNLGLIPGLLNDALQWNWDYFGKDATRLVLNTTLGLGGLFDVAGNAGIPWHPQGFGYTLAKWGGPDTVNQPAYLVLPILGSSTVSDTVGLVVDIYTYPVTYVSPVWLQNTMIAAYTLQKNADAMPQYQAITSTALDPYVAVREAYLQNRAYNIQQIKYDGHVPDSLQSNGPPPPPPPGPSATDQ